MIDGHFEDSLELFDGLVSAIELAVHDAEVETMDNPVAEFDRSLEIGGCFRDTRLRISSVDDGNQRSAEEAERRNTIVPPTAYVVGEVERGIEPDSTVCTAFDNAGERDLSPVAAGRQACPTGGHGPDSIRRGVQCIFSDCVFCVLESGLVVMA